MLPLPCVQRRLLAGADPGRPRCCAAAAVLVFFGLSGFSRASVWDIWDKLPRTESATCALSVWPARCTFGLFTCAGRLLWRCLSRPLPRGSLGQQAIHPCRDIGWLGLRLFWRRLL